MPSREQKDPGLLNAAQAADTAAKDTTAEGADAILDALILDPNFLESLESIVLPSQAAMGRLDDHLDAGKLKGNVVIGCAMVVRAEPAITPGDAAAAAAGGAFTMGIWAGFTAAMTWLHRAGATRN